MHSKSRQRVAGVIVFLVAAWLAVSPRMALAHAVLLTSTPQKDAAVSGPDLTISLKYNSRVDGARSSLSLVKPDGSVERIGALTQPLPDTLSATGHKLARGSYVLRWQVLSSDGHITRGEVPFHVE
jgi:methionine-rich copper-binding protein CopC